MNCVEALGSLYFIEYMRTFPESAQIFCSGPKRSPTGDLLKLDVQGAELRVLQGATRCLARAEAVLLELSVAGSYQYNDRKVLPPRPPLASTTTYDHTSSHI